MTHFETKRLPTGVSAFMDQVVQDADGATLLGDPRPAAADSARNTPARDDRHEYDLLRVEWIRMTAHAADFRVRSAG